MTKNRNAFIFFLLVCVSINELNCNIIVIKVTSGGYPRYPQGQDIEKCLKKLKIFAENFITFSN